MLFWRWRAFFLKINTVLVIGEKTVKIDIYIHSCWLKCLQLEDPPGFVLRDLDFFIVTPPMSFDFVNGVEDHARGVSIVMVSKMSGDTMFFETIFNIYDMFSDPYM